VLWAYSKIDSDLGYSQGMNFIAGLCLAVFGSELESFWTFMYIMQYLNWREMFTQEMPKLHDLFELTHERVRIKAPHLHLHLH